MVFSGKEGQWPMMDESTDDVRVRGIAELTPPSEILSEFPITARAKSLVADARHAIHRVLHGADDRLVVIIGPCSIHDVKAAKDTGAGCSKCVSAWPTTSSS